MRAPWPKPRPKPYAKPRPKPRTAPRPNLNGIGNRCKLRSKPRGRGRLRCDRPFRLQDLQKTSGGVGELGGEIGNRLRVDFAFVPLLDHGKVGAAGLPILAALPAVTGKVVRSGGQHLGVAAQHSSGASAVEAF